MSSKPKVIVIGASAGGADPLRHLLKQLPSDFPAAILIVMHIGSHNSILPKILNNDAALPVTFAEDNAPILPSVVTVAPPDHHLLVEDGMTRLSKGAKENFSRPAIDPLFRSAAVFYRENAIGVILSGLLDDGTVGLQAIKAYGGIALVQDPKEAKEPAMPLSALRYVDVDACLPINALAQRLVEIIALPRKPIDLPASSHSMEVQTRFDLRNITDMAQFAEIAEPSTFTCPECNGSLWEIKSLNPSHFRCHTGHIFTVQGLSDAQDNLIEEAVWSAIRALHEKQLLLQRLAKSSGNFDPKMANEHKATAEKISRHAELLRRMITQKNEEQANV